MLWQTRHVVMIGLVLVYAFVVAAASSSHGSVFEPQLVHTQPFGDNDASEFATMRSYGLNSPLISSTWSQVVMMTANTLLALSPTGTHFYSVPDELSSSIGLLISPGSSFDDCLFVVPYQNSDVFTQVTCSAPFSGTCELTARAHVNLPNVGAGTVWRDMGVTMDGNEILVFSDTMLVMIQCQSPCECSQFVRTIHFSALSTSASKFPFLISANVWPSGDTWIFLTTNHTDQRTAPGLLIAAEIAGKAEQTIATTFLLPGAGAVCQYQTKNTEVVAISAIDPVSSLASLFTFYVHRQNLMVINPFPLANSTNEIFVINGASTPLGMQSPPTASPSFLVTQSLSHPAVNVYAHVIGSSHLTSKPAVVNGTQFGAMTAVADPIGAHYSAYVGAFDLTSGSNVLLTFDTPVFQGGSSTEIPTSSTTTAAADDAERLAGAPQSRHIEEQLLAYAHGLIGEAELALSMPPEPLTACTDKTQPPTCLESCSPLPSVICGPTIPPPAGYQCFLMPTQPDACNNCPAQYSSECNSS